MKFYITLIAIFIASIGMAQQKKEVLLKIDNQPFYSKEFVKVYQKNLDLVQDKEQRSVDGYMKLFIDYKLKVAEAKAQGLDKDEEYLKDFAKYEEQLSRNYIYEDNITNDLAREAYDRGQEEIAANHILITCNWDAFPQDTLAAYNKIKEIREKALGGEDFKALVAKYSEEPGARERDGDLGYFSVFDMVYPFESEAYKTKVGEVSNIVRTQFGYHIIKVRDRRPKLPPVTVSHIMISTREDSTNQAKKRIEEIYQLLKQGESFEELAKQYSDDKNTGREGGKMRPFTKGQLKAPPFEDASYNLKNVGEITEPVQTRFGWHIIRLEKKHDIETFEEAKSELERRIKDGERAKIITSAITDKIKHKFGFESYPYQKFFEEFITDSIFKKKWKFQPFISGANQKLFKIGDSLYTYNDFGKYIEERQGKVRPYKQKRTLVRVLYDEFETIKVKSYFRTKLEMENDDYAAIINEYRDGLLIFEVMEKNVWNMAKLDTAGLKKYYDKHKSEYIWKERGEGAIFRSSDKSNIKKVEEMLKAGKSPDEIKASMNTDSKINVMVTKGLFEKGSNDLPSDFKLKEGVSKIFEKDGTFTLVSLDQIFKEGIKPYELVEGRVLSDYQNKVEKDWMESLHKKFKVEIDNKTLDKVKKELGS